MFSNKLIRELASSSDQHKLRLSESDWHLILNANKDFTEEAAQWKGSKLWGKYLLSSIRDSETLLSFRDSLELCCGNGFLFFSFKDIFNLDDNSHFIDLSEPQINAFIQRCKSADIKPPDIRCGDIGDLPFENASLRMVYGNSFLHHLPDVGKYLQEVNRVLKKGGRFIAFHEPTPTAPFLESFPRSIFRDVDTGSLTDIWVIKPDVMYLLLKEAGFEKIKIIPNNFMASLLITPWSIVFAKLGLPYQGNIFVILKLLCGKLDSLLPTQFLLRYAPSIAIVAEK